MDIDAPNINFPLEHANASIDLQTTFYDIFLPGVSATKSTYLNCTCVGQ